MTLAACTAACGEGEPCARLAEFYLYGWAGATKDEAQAWRLYERACEGRYVPACDLLVVQAEIGTPGLAAAEARLRSIAGDECKKGRADGCFYLAELLFDRDLYRRACELGSLRACSKLTYKPVATDTDDTRPYHVRSSLLRKKACEDGDAEVCWWFGNIIRMTKLAMTDVPESESDAVALLGGVSLSSGPSYIERAITLWRAQCEAGWVRACVDAGDALSDAKPVPRREEARAFFRRACEWKDERACEWLSH